MELHFTISHELAQELKRACRECGMSIDQAIGPENQFAKECLEAALAERRIGKKLLPANDLLV